MQLDGFVEQVQDQLAAAAALGDDRVKEVAAALTSATAPAVRLAILAALAEAADEITAALLDRPDSPAVSVQLDSDDIRISVSAGPSEPTPPPRVDDGDASARISLRLSEALKAEIDAAATRAGQSVNSWLIRTVSNAVGTSTRSGPTQRLTGWINS